MEPAPKKKIFISYRVKDTQAATGRLVDALKQYFDDDQIFMDIDKIEPGLDFTEVIPRYLDSSEVMLAIIGPDWMAYNKDKNTYRIHEPHDWVRVEIATALQRNIRVVPVLLEGASLPEEDQLPDDLKPLLRRQSYEISNKRWKFDSEQLVDFLKRIVGAPPPQPRPQPKPPVPQASDRKSTKYWVIAAVVFLLLIVGKMLSENSGTGHDTPEETPTNTVQPVAQEPQYSTPQDNAPDAGPAATEPQGIAGRWITTAGDRDYQFTQKGETVFVTIHEVSSGIQTGNGSGYIREGNIRLNLTVKDYQNLKCTFEGTLSEDARTITALIVISDGSDQQSMNLVMNRQ